MRTPHFFAVLLASLACAASALCQPNPRRQDEAENVRCIRDQGPIAPFPRDRFRHYELRTLSPAGVDSLQTFLEDGCFEHALRVYFPDSRSDRFVDWVVYIDSSGYVRQAVTRGWRAGQEYRAEQYVWVLVFWDRSLVANGDCPGRLRFARRSVSYRPPPTLTTLVRAVAGKFFAGSAPASAPVLADTSKPIVLQQLAAKPDSGAMCAALDRYELAEDSQVELSLHPDSGQALPGTLRSVYTNIGNAPRSTWEFGIAAGLAFGRRTEVPADGGDAVAGTRPGLQPNLYLTGYVNLAPPRTQQRRSFGPVVGVNLARGGLFDELVTGVALGHVVEDVGLIVAGSWNNVKYFQRDAAGKVTGYRERRRLVPLVALDLRL
jgi:hypothetical protein